MDVPTAKLAPKYFDDSTAGQQSEPSRVVGHALNVDLHRKFGLGEQGLFMLSEGLHHVPNLENLNIWYVNWPALEELVLWRNGNLSIVCLAERARGV